MSFKDLNDNIKQKIYEYDNTYHEIFNKVLYEIKPYFDKKIYTPYYKCECWRCHEDDTIPRLNSLSAIIYNDDPILKSIDKLNYCDDCRSYLSGQVIYYSCDMRKWYGQYHIDSRTMNKNGELDMKFCGSFDKHD